MAISAHRFADTSSVTAGTPRRSYGLPAKGDRAIAWTLEDGCASGDLPAARALVHCAYDMSLLEEREVWRVNVGGTRRLLGSASAAGVKRMLVLSSMSAYDRTRQVYGRAKLEIERLTLTARGIAVRPGLVYGQSAGGMAGTLRALARLPVMPDFGAGARQFPVHEDDLCTVIGEVLGADDWIPEVFGIAQSHSVTFRDLLRSFAGGTVSRHVFVPTPWRVLFAFLRAAERAGLRPPVRADSLLGLVRPAHAVPGSVAFPQLQRRLRELQVPHV